MSTSPPLGSSARNSVESGSAIRTAHSPQRRTNARPTVRSSSYKSGPKTRPVSIRARRQQTRLIVAASFLLVLLGVFSLIVSQVLIAQSQFRLERLKVRADSAQDQYQRLRLEVAQLESPDRIIIDAQNRLGMVTPERVTYLTPKSDEMSLPSNGIQGLVDKTDAPWMAVKPYLVTPR